MGTEFSISPSGTAMKDGKKVKADGKTWRGPRAIRHLRWEGASIRTKRPLAPR